MSEVAVINENKSQETKSERKGEHQEKLSEDDSKTYTMCVGRGLTGTLKKFFGKKGYGFITRDDNGEAIFFHRSGIFSFAIYPEDNFYDIQQGDKVEFDVIIGRKGLKAVGITQEKGYLIPVLRRRFFTERFYKENNYKSEPKKIEEKDKNKAEDSEKTSDDKKGKKKTVRKMKKAASDDNKKKAKDAKEQIEDDKTEKANDVIEEETNEKDEVATGEEEIDKNEEDADDEEENKTADTEQK